MTGRGQGAFEYLLILGGTVLVASVVLIIVQGSASEVNNTLVVSSNDYLSALSNQQQGIEQNFTTMYTTPAGCAFSNPPCAGHNTCNSTTNSCEAVENTTRNGCDFLNPGCPFGYYCQYNYCLPDPHATPTLANGACGASNGAKFYSAPTTNLCTAGSVSAVTGSGPWYWTCVGSNGGTTVGCSANVIINGACGSSNGAAFASMPSSGLCSAGSASAVSGSGPWSWSCIGVNGGTNASCSANLPGNGVCGSSSGAAFAYAPTVNLCSAGNASAVSGAGPWAWYCNATTGGSTASCSANLIVDGACGSSNGANVYSAPSSGLCTAGSASALSGAGPWSWTCSGLYGGTNASCSANLVVNGTCGSSGGSYFPSTPSANLCGAGIASSVSGSGPWSWTCSGINGGSAASCSASSLCGSSNGTGVYSAPTSGLCNSGTASAVSGSGPWAWTCTGTNGVASCSAKLRVDGACGSDNGTHLPTVNNYLVLTNPCSKGTLGARWGSFGYSWNCDGVNGGSTASCRAWRNVIMWGTHTISECTSLGGHVHDDTYFLVDCLFAYYGGCSYACCSCPSGWTAVTECTVLADGFAGKDCQ
ncbi:MAG: hypothetical protein WCX64_05920 [Candidatus Micrarchaeia archaeon]